METLTEPITTERLLIYSNDQEINRVTCEIQERARLLNEISKHGLSQEEIKNITSSKFSIDQFVENQLLKENKDYARMKKAGIQGITATLSNELQRLRDALTAWESYKPSSRDGNKYSGLTVEGNTWKVDGDRLEREFEMRGQKIYVEGEQLKRYRRAEQLITLLKFFNVDWNHIHSAPSLAKVIDANGQRIIPKWQYFKRP